MQRYITVRGDTVELIAWQYYGSQGGDVIDQVLAANPGLADYGPTIAEGVVVNLPEITAAATEQGVKLWD